MRVLTRLRKLIVGKDFSKGIISGLVRKKTLNALSDNYQSGDKILDVGCGEGLFLLKCAKIIPDSKLTGVDNWEKILEYTKQRLIIENIDNVDLVLSEGEALPFEDSAFQHVFFINAVHNQKDTNAVKGVINEMLRVCSDMGRVYFDIRNKNNIFFRIMYKFVLLFDSSKPTVNMYSKKDISSIMEKMDYSGIKYYPIDISRTGYLVEVTK
ncbi:class I SAM-dependent methyltransferase [Elusimicrobiota bacterium]